jgi:nucleotide-binding universal stress UspA family protein
MKKILLPVDGSPNSDRAVRHAIALAQAVASLEIYLLNVQEPIDAWEVRRFLPAAEIEAMQESAGGDALKSARALLDAAAVAYHPEVRIGPVPETIATAAAEHGCDAIVMGTRGHGGVDNLVLGSVATKVVHLSGVPVTLVK